MNQKIKELLEAIMEEAMGICNTADTALAPFPTGTMSNEEPEHKFEKQKQQRQKKGQLNYKFVKMHKKGKVQ